MPDHPNKPGNDDGAGSADDQAVENQGSVTPDDYPKGGDGTPDYKDREES